LETPRISGAGICCLDYIVIAPQPEWGGRAHVSGFHVQGGGLVATAIVACARLGAPCDLYSLLGDDHVGDQILDEVRQEGVSTDGVLRVPGGESPFSFIHVDEGSGERTIFHRPGLGLDRPWEFQLAPVAQSGALLIDHCYPHLAVAASKIAREHGVPVVADMELTPRDAELARYVDALIAPQDFARQSGFEADPAAALDLIHEHGPSIAVITLGAAGWVYSGPDGRGRGDGFRVDVVDTTGAGDVFHGAFAYALARGWGTGRCCEFAGAVAAMKCTKPGGRTGLPSLEQTIAFLRDRGRDWLPLP